jgi:hypothetical protein
MKCSTKLPLRPFACKENSDENKMLNRVVPGENSDENEVLDRIVPGAIYPLGRTRIRIKCSTELSLGAICPWGELG